MPAARDDILDDLDFSGLDDLDWLSNLTQVTADLPDIYGEVVLDYDFSYCEDHRERARAIIAAQGALDRPAAMQSAKVLSIEKIDTNSLNTSFMHLVELDCGVTAFAKMATKKPLAKVGVDQRRDRHAALLNECAAYSIASLLGKRYERLMMPLILRKHEGRLCLLVAKAPGKVASECSYGTLDHVSTADVCAAALFDALIANSDRHSANYLLTESGSAGADRPRDGLHPHRLRPLR